MQFLDQEALHAVTHAHELHNLILQSAIGRAEIGRDILTVQKKLELWWFLAIASSCIYKMQPLTYSTQEGSAFCIDNTLTGKNVSSSWKGSKLGESYQ